MHRDPFRAKIVEALSGRLDGNLFEPCACDLLRSEYPTLVPIPGGSDFGMDGETAGDGPFLVATTDESPIRNLTRSLNSVLRSGVSGRPVIVATSRPLSPIQRRNLKNRAEEKGFSLHQIYSRAAMADMLYHEPQWCLDLLGLTGKPPALSRFPRTSRLAVDQPIIGREDSRQWLLREQTGDRILVGVPGSGKTFLLRHLVETGEALFLVDDDKIALAQALRELAPKTIIVDDAQFCREDLLTLRQMRSELRADFSILASSWPGERHAVFECLSSTDAFTLGLLADGEIVEVLEGIGIAGPNDLLRAIVDQARGRPGLAVTLGRLCQSGQWRKVLMGEAIYQNLMVIFQRLVGESATDILSVLALGGDSGMKLDIVARELLVPLPDVRRAINGLAAGGVISEAGDCLSVWPEVLRFVLVRDTFFDDLGRLPIQPFINHVPSIPDLARTLIGAKSRGAEMPAPWLRSFVELAAASNPLAWNDYASLGEEEAVWVLTHHCRHLDQLAPTILRSAPASILPLLLRQAVGDDRELRSTSEHPLRRIQDWIQSANYDSFWTVDNRKSLLTALQEFHDGGGDQKVSARAMAILISPQYEKFEELPGRDAMGINSGLFSRGELEEISLLWEPAKGILSAINPDHWKPILGAVEEWASPVFPLPKDAAEYVRQAAGPMVCDLGKLAPRRPGVQQWVKTRLKWLRVEAEVVLDLAYDALFPPDDELHDEAHLQQVQELARVLLDESEPQQVISQIMAFEKDYAVTGSRGSRHTPYLCAQIAASESNPAQWLRVLVETDAPPDLLQPFLANLVRKSATGWEKMLSQSLQDQRYQGIAVELVLELPNPPEGLLSEVLKLAPKYAHSVRFICRRGTSPPATVRALLRHIEEVVSTAAAVGILWGAPNRKVEGEVYPDWRAAAERATEPQHQVSALLEAHPELAYPWLRNRLRGDAYYESRSLKTAISQLNRNERLQLLQSWNSGYHDQLLADVIEIDIELYREFLVGGEIVKWKLRPLLRWDEKWTEKALVALEVGYKPGDIAQQGLSATLPSSGWMTSRQAFDPVALFQELAKDESQLRSVGKEGLRLIEEQRSEKR